MGRLVEKGICLSKLLVNSDYVALRNVRANWLKRMISCDQTEFAFMYMVAYKINVV